MNPDPAAASPHETELCDLGLVVNDRETAETLMRIVGAVTELYDLHAFDKHGRCRRCRPIRRGFARGRHTCTVYQAMATYRVGRPVQRFAAGGMRPDIP
jgi:hypothetical protein